VRYLILSDIHGNWEALTAVRQHARRKRVDRVLFLGDAVGYGASPNHVLEWLRTLSPEAIVVRGNHDRVCAKLEGGEYFNRHALVAAEWTARHLDERNAAYLKNLPEGPLAVDDDVVICHGSPDDEDTYIFSGYDAAPAFACVTHPVIFFGHTHVPSLFTFDSRGPEPTMSVQLLAGDRQTIDVEEGCRYLVNPGSVGQPRDRVAKAAYAIWDGESRRIYHYRVSYPAARARKRIIRAGLPAVLGDRLLHGV
jgi:predicted phosphodiesterase